MIDLDSHAAADLPGVSINIVGAGKHTILLAVLGPMYTSYLIDKTKYVCARSYHGACMQHPPVQAERVLQAPALEFDCKFVFVR